MWDAPKLVSMKFMLLICPDADKERRLTPEQGKALGAATEAWLKETGDRGVRLEGGRLKPSSDAITVRLCDANARVTQGPFAESKEQIIGYSLLECADLDEAVEVAAKHPVAEIGAIEVRPLST